MIETKTVPATSEAVVAKVCDRCGRRAESRSPDFECGEFISIRHDCGYGSVFGDGCRIEIDVCQHCISELFGSIARVKQNEEIEC